MKLLGANTVPADDGEEHDLPLLLAGRPAKARDGDGNRGIVARPAKT